jgi:hypothetical protein
MEVEATPTTAAVSSSGGAQQQLPPPGPPAKKKRALPGMPGDCRFYLKENSTTSIVV